MSSPDTTLSKSTSRHPAGLYVLFGAEMWERLSFYGMRALLVLYLTNHLDYARADALRLYATYTSLVYLTPLIGGYLADRVLGQRKAIFIGGTLMALGHFTMAFESYLYPALGLLIIGNGFFKPNISTMVGQLYEPSDSRRDSAYLIFYMGINTGAFIAPIICGYLGESARWGWHWGFGAAGVGMVLGLINFGVLQGFLQGQGYPPDRQEQADRGLGFVDFLHVVLITAVGTALVFAATAPVSTIANLIPNWTKTPVLTYWGALVAVLIGASWLIAGGRSKTPKSPATADESTTVDPEHVPFTRADWSRVVVILVVAIFSIVFWMGFEQAGGTFTLFAKEKTDRSLPALLAKPLDMPEFPASWYQTINPLLIVLLAPAMIVLWNTLERIGIRINSAAKMALGMIILGVGFIVMEYADTHSTLTNKAGPQWLLIVYMFNSVGELVFPIGLSLVNKLAHKIASIMMAIWFVCTGLANYLAGTLEEILKENIPDLNLYTFLKYASFVPGVVLLILSPLMKKMSHGRL